MSPIKEILVLHHSHLDLGYTHSQPVMQELQIEYINQALDLLDETADWPELSQPKWTCEVTEPVIWWLRQASDSDVERFGHFLQAGRLAISGLSLNGTPLSDAVSLSHQFKSKCLIENRFGINIRTANIHDVNGMPWTLVDLMIDEGIELLITAVNAHLGRPVDGRPGVFRWMGPSGRSVLVMNGSHYTMFDQNLFSWDDSLDRMSEGWEDFQAYLDGRNYPFDFCYLTTTHSPEMWDNAPPNLFVADLIRAWNNGLQKPPIRYITPVELLERIKLQPENLIPSYSGDWTDYWVFGAGATVHETKVCREARRMLFAADLAGIQTPGKPETKRLTRSRSVMDEVTVFEEHTWGSYDTEINSEQHIAQEHIKTNSAFLAREQAFWRLAEELDDLAENPVSTGRIQSILVYNPSSSHRNHFIRIPPAWREKGRFIRANRFQNGSLAANQNGELSGPVKIAPYSYRRIELESLEPVTEQSGLSHKIEVEKSGSLSLNVAFDIGIQFSGSHSTETISNPWYQLRFESETGHISSLLDLKRDREILTNENSGFFDVFRERTNPLLDGSRTAFHQRDLEKEKRDISNWKAWQAIREGADRVVSVSLEKHPDEYVFTTVYDAPGLRNLTRRITLRSDSALIGIEVSFIKEVEDSPEATYFKIPLSLNRGWRAHFDTAGVSTELDKEQLPGSCRGWLCVDNYISMSEKGFGAALFCPDAPLVMPGGFNFGPPVDSIRRTANPLMLAWPMNNYWDTNFGRIQPGFKRLRYEFMTHGEFDSVEMARIADLIRNPVYTLPSASPPSKSVQLISCDNGAATILGIERSIGADGIRICLFNYSEVSISTLLSVRSRISMAWVSTPGGRNGETLPVSEGKVVLNLPPRRITWICIIQAEDSA